MEEQDKINAFGGKVRELRKVDGLTQEGLAELCELERSYISDLERGRRNPSLKCILTLASALDVAPSELFKEIPR